MENIEDELPRRFRTIEGEQEEPFVLCLQCKKSIPAISLFKNTDDSFIELTCKECKSDQMIRLEDYLSILNQKESHVHYCSMKEGHSNDKAIKYCLICQKWICQACFLDHTYYAANHQFFSRELKIEMSCKQHSKSQTYHCIKCSLIICKKCKETKHKDHQMISLEDLRNEIDKINQTQMLKEIKRIKQKVKEQKDQIVKEIDNEIAKWIKRKNDVLSAYDANERINNQTETLIIYLLGNYEMLRDIPSYEMLANVINNISIKPSNIQFNFPNCIDNVNSFINYLNSHYYTNFKKKNDNSNENHYKCTQNIQINSEVNTMINLSDNRIAIGCEDNLIRISDYSLRKFDIVLKQHTMPIECLFQLIDGRLVSSSNDKMFILWNIEEQLKVNQIEEDVVCMSQLKDTTFVTGLRDHRIKIWNLSFKCINILKGHFDLISSIIQLKDSRLVSASHDKSIQLWNCQEKKSPPIKTLFGHSDKITSIVQSSNNGRLMSSSLDKTIIIWNIKDMTIIRKLEMEISDSAFLYQLSKNCILVGNDKNVVVLNSYSYKIITTLTGHCKSVTGIAVLKDEILVSSSLDKTIRLWKK